MRRHLRKLDQEVRSQGDQLSHDLTMHLKWQEERLQSFLAGIEETLTRHDQVQRHMQQDMMQIQQKLLSQRETLLLYMEQQRGEIEVLVQQRWSEFAFERAIQYEQMERIEQRLVSIERQDQATQKSSLEYQEHAQDQDQQIQKLTVLLHDERMACQMLSEQFALQQEQIQALSRELECMKTHKTVSDGE